MALVNQVQKKIRMDQWDIVKFQLIVYCTVNKIEVTKLELDCLTLLALSGEQTLNDYCKLAYNSKISNSIQSARNMIVKAETKVLIIRKERDKKRIKLNIQNIQTEGNILLDYKILRIESEES